ncbi:ArsR/SmtB family transcription factor [Nonomuraea sp. NPDC003560]|uniref:ArsR/SmtB family transcription factor n=1 Tax=Nonomuraea sp. NPDC003560 TaxID=3364341 RepID=UPI00368B72ED
MADPSLPPILVFPIQHEMPDDVPDDALPDLLGATRARVLRCIAATDGRTTSELARRTGASLSSASTHAQVLQRAGLITSTRHANMVIHQLTRLGGDLIHRQQ